MAKSTKNADKLPKFEDYKPSFVTGEGEDREVDVDAALKALYTLMVDKAKAQDAAEDIKAEKAEVVTQRDELQAKVDDKNAPDAQVEIGKANAKVTAAEDRATKAEQRADRLEVASEKNLTAKQAKYLPQTGTKEELEAAADEILEDFPEVAANPSGNEDEDPEENEGRQTPRLVNGSDPKLGKVETEFDYEKWADQQVSNRF